MKKQIRLTVIFAVLLILAVGYIAFDKYTTAKQEEQMSVFQQGAQYGFEQAIVQIAQQAVTCQQVPLHVGNQTISMIAVGCLQPAAQE